MKAHRNLFFLCVLLVTTTVLLAADANQGGQGQDKRHQTQASSQVPRGLMDLPNASGSNMARASQEHPSQAAPAPAVHVIPPAAAFAPKPAASTSASTLTQPAQSQTVVWHRSKKPLVAHYDRKKAVTNTLPQQTIRNFRRAVPRPARPDSPGSNLSNGGFEANPTVLNNWTVVDQAGGSGSWFVQTGTGAPFSGLPVAAPPEGVQAAMADQGGPGSHILYQDFVVPPGGVLSFDLFVHNWAAGWFVPVPETLDYTVSPNQQIRADIMNPAAPVDDVGSGVLQNLFLSQPSDPTAFGYITVTADMSAFAGQTVRLRFAEVDNQSNDDMGVDNVFLSAGAIGLVADNVTNSVVAFDPKTDTVIGSLPLPSCGALGAVAISPDGTLGFVTNFCNAVWVIDLTVTPPAIAGGTNPIPISQTGEDLAITPDGRYLLSTNPGISVIDIAARAEIGTNGTGAQSVAVCPDHSVLTGGFFADVHRFTIDGSGTLTDTGDNNAGMSPLNVSCAPGNVTGLEADFNQAVKSFAIPGLALDDSKATTASTGQTVITNRAGTRAYVRSDDCTTPTVDYFNYNRTTGALTAAGISFSLAAPASGDCWFGIDQLALYGSKLYASQGGSVGIFDAITGASIGTLTNPAISNPTGIAIYTPPATGLGLVADNNTNSVVVFDPGTDTVTGVVPVPGIGATGDVKFNKDGTLGFVTNFANQIYVIDLTQTPPVLASGTNPIVMSQAGEDLSLTPDGQYLVSCDGGGVSPVSVINIAARAETSTFAAACNAVEVCQDNSVLIGDFGGGTVRRLLIDSGGNLTDTGDIFGGSGPLNVTCGRASLTGLVADFTNSQVRSLGIPGLVLLGAQPTGLSQTVVSNRAGNEVFSRDCIGNINVFDYNFISGALTPRYVIPDAGAACFYGMDTLAVHPDGSKFYTSEGGAVNVYDASNGNLITSITDSAISAPTGVAVFRGNARPEAIDDSFVTIRDTPLNVGAPGVVANDTDANGDSLTAALNSGPSNGTLTLNIDGSFSYMPNAGFFGQDTFVYHANDGSDDSNIATVHIRVDARPVAVDDSYSTNKNVALNIGAPGVLANDSDPDGDPITANLDVPPAHGTVTLNSNGSFLYTPNPGFSGVDSFQYFDFDGIAGSNFGTVTITVINHPPVANNDVFGTTRNATLNVPAPGVLANDTDADADPLTAALNAGPANGTVVLNANGSFTYTPNTGFVGVDSFTYHANDGTADSNLALVNINVIDNPPVANNDSYTADRKNTPFNVVVASGVLFNDTDVNNDPLTAVLDSGPSNGTVVLNADGSFTYTPNLEFIGTDSFTYHANDGVLDSNVATVQVTVPLCPTGALFCDDFSSLDFNTVFGPWTMKPLNLYSALTGDAVATTTKKADLISPNFGGCTDCTFEARMSIGTLRGRVSLFGWYQNSKNFVEVRLFQDKQKVLIMQRSTTGGKAKAKILMPINLNQVYDVEVNFNSGSGQFTVTIDGVPQPGLTLHSIATPTGNEKFRLKSTTGAPTTGTWTDTEVF